MMTANALATQPSGKIFLVKSLTPPSKNMQCRSRIRASGTSFKGFQTESGKFTA